jgi:hypothetical protein
MSKPWSHKVIALLALIQGVFGLLRAYNWVQMGTNLFGQGLLLLPFVGGGGGRARTFRVHCGATLRAICCWRLPRKKLALVAWAHRSSDQSPSRIRRRRARGISDPGIGLVGGSCNFNFFILFAPGAYALTALELRHDEPPIGLRSNRCGPRCSLPCRDEEAF